jgi:hypothetical protein
LFVVREYVVLRFVCLRKEELFVTIDGIYAPFHPKLLEEHFSTHEDGRALDKEVYDCGPKKHLLQLCRPKGCTLLGRCRQPLSDGHDCHDNAYLDNE